METEALCHCGKSLQPRFRRYCAEHSPLASLLWKRAQRQACRGTAYWLDYWLNLTGDERSAREAYNAYMRNYMRRYRRARYRGRLGQRAAASPEVLAVQFCRSGESDS